MNITGHTRLLCLIGDPVAHSSSPAMHNCACRELGLDYAYVAIQLDKEHIREGIESLRTLGIRGFNITMPGKITAADVADVLSPEAYLSHSVNTMIVENGKLYGYSTDGYGFMESLRQNNVDLTGENLTLMGSGGAATAICTQAALDGAREIAIFRRHSAGWEDTFEFARQVTSETGAIVSVHDISDENTLKEKVNKSRVLANATSVGMAPNDNVSLIKDYDILHSDLAVFDAVYHPLETKLMKEARKRDLICISGLSMLLYQGEKAFEHFTGKKMPVDHVKQEVFKDLLKVEALNKK